MRWIRRRREIAPGGVAVLTRAGTVVLVRVLEVDGVLVEADTGEPVDWVDVVLVEGLPELVAS